MIFFMNLSDYLPLFGLKLADFSCLLVGLTFLFVLDYEIVFHLRWKWVGFFGFLIEIEIDHSGPFLVFAVSGGCRKSNLCFGGNQLVRIVTLYISLSVSCNCLCYSVFGTPIISIGFWAARQGISDWLWKVVPKWISYKHSKSWIDSVSSVCGLLDLIFESTLHFLTFSSQICP